MTRLIVTQENAESEEYDFAEEIRTITLGRRTTNDVCIPDLSVSGNHARITIGDAGAMLEDLNSTNGTYVNGRLISRQLLNADDEIVCGKSRVVFEPALIDERADDNAAAPGAAHPLDNIDDHLLDDSSEVAVVERANVQVQASDHTLVQQSARQQRQARTEPRQAPRHAAVIPANNTLDDSSNLPQDVLHELDESPVTGTGAVIEIKNGAKSGQVLPIDKPVTTLGRPGIQIAAIMKKPEGYFLMHIESEQENDRPRLNNEAIGDEPVMLHSGDSLNVAGIDVQFMLS